MRRSRLPAVALALACIFGVGPVRGPAARAADAPIPFAVNVFTENDNGLGSMRLADMAKLVTLMSASGAPAGTYKAALDAGMKPVWYQDAGRIGDAPGHMSDRPPVTDLQKDGDLMKCARGGLLDATYSPQVGTYFGDPSAANLVRQTNAQLAKAAAHYGPIAFAWLDDSMLITDEWAAAWSCGGAPFAHGYAPAGEIRYANGSPYTPQNFLEHLIAFDDAVRVPVLDEGACVGDGTALGGSAEDPGGTVALAVGAKNAAGVLCENFAEGWGNRQTVNGKAVDAFWKSDLNSGIRVISAHKLFVNYQYIGNEGASNRGTTDDYDQRGYIEASFMLIFDDAYSVYKTGAWGAHLGVKAPVMVLPENLLVPLRPLTTATWPQRIDALKRGGVYVREFADCAVAGRSIGPCAAVVNPASSAQAALPLLQQRYNHALAFTGNDGAFTGKHGTPNYGDTGDLDLTTHAVPSALPPAGWTILVR